MGLLLCFVMPVFSWCSFTTSVANSKMKLLVWNRGLGHRVLCLRVLGWLFLIAVKQVSASDVAAVGALEQVSFSKEIKPESQRLNITHFSRVFLFYSTNKKPVFCEQYIESYKQANFTVSLAASAVHSTVRFILQIWLYLSPVLIRLLVHLVLSVTEWHHPSCSHI